MSDLIASLPSFNRTERFILLREALGEDTFCLDAGFRTRLGETIGEALPADAFVAMDDPLDWLQMALSLAATPAPEWPVRNDRLVDANPQDADLLVAFGDGAAQTHLVLLEAKMETGWTNVQMDATARRLWCLVEDKPGAGLATPHFVLLSPRRPERLRSHDWPHGMTPGQKPRWMEWPARRASAR